MRKRLLLWLLDMAQLGTKQKCWAYGGIMVSDAYSKGVGIYTMSARVCTKTRWHWDSHAYEWIDA